MSCVLSLKTIRRISNELRERGESVVLTHGAFDLFHSGHASLLKESKKLGNYLIVGVESDAVSYTHLDVYKRQLLCCLRNDYS